VIAGSTRTVLVPLPALVISAQYRRTLLRCRECILTGSRRYAEGTVTLLSGRFGTLFTRRVAVRRHLLTCEFGFEVQQLPVSASTVLNGARTILRPGVEGMRVGHVRQMRVMLLTYRRYRDLRFCPDRTSSIVVNQLFEIITRYQLAAKPACVLVVPRAR